MKEITMFYLESCPYCKKAAKAIEELQAENERYRAIPIRRIEESQDPETAEKYDYWSVPSMFVSGEKLYEATMWQDYEEIRDNIKRVFDTVLEN